MAEHELSPGAFITVAVLTEGCGAVLSPTTHCCYHAPADPACICQRVTRAGVSHITSLNAACRAHDIPAEVNHA